MIVLGLDTATQATAVALRLSNGDTLQARDDPGAGEHPGHATRLLEMTEELLAGAALGWSAIERIAVGVGPGTFTGLRVGIASARGLAQSLDVPLVGVSSLRALAAAALADPGAGVEGHRPGTVLAVIDARRGEVFAAAYSSPNGGSPGEGREGEPAELLPPIALAPGDLGALVEGAGWAHGRPPSSWLAVGDGAVRFHEQVSRAGLASPSPESHLHRVSAASICDLGERARVLDEVDAVVPDYRRRPDAELALEGAGGVAGGRP